MKKTKNFDAIYNEFLKEMCEDLKIDVNDADVDLKAIAIDFTIDYIADNLKLKYLK